MKRTVMILMAMMMVAGYVYLNFITTFKTNVVQLSYLNDKGVQFFFPQGWGFFTRNPREAKYKLYQWKDEKLKLINYKITSSNNYFGFSRRGNRISMEIERLKDQLPKASNWTPATGQVHDLELESLPFDEQFPKPDGVNYIEKGKYIIMQYHITPWAWLRFHENYHTEFSYLGFELQ